MVQFSEQYGEFANFKIARLVSPAAVFVVYCFCVAFDFLAIAPGVSLSRVMTYLLIIRYAWRIKNLKIITGSESVVYLLLLLVGMFATTFNGVTGSSVISFLTLALNVVVMILVLGINYEDRQIDFFNKAIIYSALVLCMLLFLTPGHVGTEWVSDRIVVNIAGSQQDPNQFCGYLIPLSCYATYSVFSKRRIRFLPVLVFVFYCILLTGSRGGLIANIAGCAVALAFAVKNSKHKGILIAVILLLSGMVLLNLDSVLETLPPSVADRFNGVTLGGGTASSRTRAWENVLQSFASSGLPAQLFGHGYGATTQVTYNGLVAHNAFIEVLYTLGISGFCLYMFVILRSLKSAFQNGRYWLLASIIGNCVLLMTISDYTSKTLWTTMVIALIPGQVVNKGDVIG